MLDWRICKLIPGSKVSKFCELLFFSMLRKGQIQPVVSVLGEIGKVYKLLVPSVMVEKRSHL